MHHQTGRFVDDQQCRIVHQNAQRNRLGLRSVRARAKCGVQRDPTALQQTKIRLHGMTVDAQLAGSNPVTEPTPGKFRPDCGCGLIDTLTGLRGRGLEATLNQFGFAHR